MSFKIFLMSNILYFYKNSLKCYLNYIPTKKKKMPFIKSFKKAVSFQHLLLFFFYNFNHFSQSFQYLLSESVQKSLPS